jgi:hypothetical protein
MQTPTLAGILIAVGVIVVLVSAFADSLGFGAEATRFGWKQTLGVLLGLAAVIAGVYLRRRPGSF